MTTADTIPLPQLLTHSRMSEMKRCLRRHWFRYEIGLVRDRDEQPLRLGSAVHLGLDLLGKGKSVDAAISAAIAGYAEVPGWCQSDDDLLDWQVERATVAEMIRGYAIRWAGDGATIISSELEFCIPITNPDTGAATPLFKFAGKIDKIVKLANGSVAVREHKTTGDSIEPTSDYWRRLRIDQQISGYYLGARALGHDIQTVEYDVLRKPGIRPKLIKGVRETTDQYQERLRQDISERPEFYYARQEIPRLDADLTEFQQELWDIQQSLRSYQKRGVWFRNTAACTIMGTCPYFEPCCSGYRPDGTLPAGYKLLSDVNPELTKGSAV